jgi:RNA 2',3'-cyclic 3'-phosphodiesterase
MERSLWEYGEAMKTRRLFAGVRVEASEALRGLMADLMHDLKGERIRWTRLENLHLTIEFFGATETGRIPELELALAQAAGKAPALTMKIGGLGVFGSARHPRVLWLGIESAGLKRLHDQVEIALREMDWTPEARAFAPHLTLGRIDRLMDLQRFNQAVGGRCDFADQEQAVKDLILYESVAGRYEPLGTWPLGG